LAGRRGEEYFNERHSLSLLTVPRSLEQMMKQMSGKNGMPDMSALQSMMGGMGGFPGM
jgi:hypothetical protein